MATRRSPAKARRLARARRVHLREPVAADRRELRELRRASWGFLKPWEPWPPRGVDPCGDAWFDRVLATSRTDGSRRFVVGRNEDGAILGLVSLTQIFLGPFRSAVTGYWVGAEHARRGYMGEALPLVVRHAFRRLGLHRIEANVRPDNAASLALVRRSGFHLEGYSPRYLKIAGRWHDHERWAILADGRSGDTVRRRR